MVLLHIKGSEKDEEFIYECKCSDDLDKVSTIVTNIHNKRITLRTFANGVLKLSQFGPMRPENERLLSHRVIQETIQNPKTVKGDLDPEGLRIGEETEEKDEELLKSKANDALQYINIKRAHLRQSTNIETLDKHFELLKNAIIKVYPTGLPPYDTLQIIIDNIENVFEINESKRYKNIKTSQLWFGPKKLLRSEILSKFIGKNEKTKVIIKITKENGHMPIREPIINQQTRKQMMAYWYKRQEKDKQLSQDDDKSYLQSQWANPNALKEAFTGITNLNFR